jgi:hypothetical protein
MATLHGWREPFNGANALGADRGGDREGSHRARREARVETFTKRLLEFDP